MSRISPHFLLQELVHPLIYKMTGPRAADFIHWQTAPTLERLKSNLFGTKIKVNDWYWGGGYKNSGLRVPTNDLGAELSSHKFGTGFDLKVENMTPHEVVTHILNNEDEYPSITRIENPDHTTPEDKIGWTHVEMGTRIGKIYVFNP
jgi:hypothetical protein